MNVNADLMFYVCFFCVRVCVCFLLLGEEEGGGVPERQRLSQGEGEEGQEEEGV